MIDYKDYDILCDIEILLHSLLVEKHIPSDDSKEWELWYKYYNVVEKIAQQLDNLEKTRKEIRGCK